MKKVYICFALIFVLFLSGCTKNIRNEDENKQNDIQKNTNDTNIIDTEPIVQQKQDSALIDKCDSIECVADSFKDCKPIQFEWFDKDKKHNVIAVFGLVEDKCDVMVNKNFFKDNIECFFQKNNWTIDILKQLTGKESGKKSIIDASCKKKELELKTP